MAAAHVTAVSGFGISTLLTTIPEDGVLQIRTVLK